MQVGAQVRFGAKGTAVEHVVFFPASDGTPAFRRVPSVDEAVRLVEHLRNIEGVFEVSVYALTAVPLSFRAYYRVEMPGVEVAHLVAPDPVEPVEPAEPAEPAEPEPAAPEAVLLEPELEKEPVTPVPALALVESLPVQAGEPAPERVTSPAPARDGANSLGFFA
jgi:hypothetical protein